MIIVFIVLIASTSLIFVFNTRINNDNYGEIIASTIDDVKKDLEDTGDVNMIEQTFRIKERVVKKIDINNMPEVDEMSEYLRTIVEEEKFSEMSIVNKDNIVIYSSIDEYIGFDMNANDDTLAFDVLNHGTTEIVQPVRHNAYSGLGDYDMYNKYAGVSLEDVGYLQVGISAKRFQELIDEKVEYISSNRHIGQNGYVIISNSNDNSTIGAIKKLSEKEKEKLKEELNYAKSIQMSALPQNFPNDENYEIFALMEAAKGVGGDFYDFYKTFMHGLNFMIADVSGKGIPGAMFMMRSKSQLHTLTETGIPVNDAFTYGNDRLCENNDTGCSLQRGRAISTLRRDLSISPTPVIIRQSS